MTYVSSTPELEYQIVTILSSHVGRDKAIGRDELVAKVKSRGDATSERQVREAIKQLRRQGHLICSAPGEDGGYYLAADREEYEEFKRAEFLAKIHDMQETLRAMDLAAERAFGKAIQLNLWR